ncbi:MAG: SDR family oxidoreductase [Devosiaceae bacterium]|nr:SDR family oxidoreductase [Devosiaceae bacterium MH13]
MSKNPFTLAGRTVLIVGASSGIGAATAHLASGLGAHVVLASRSFDALEAVRMTLPHPDRAQSVAMDYLNPASIDAAIAQLGPIDHVMVSAVADENKKRGAFTELDPAIMRASFDKYWGQINVVRAAIPKLAERGSITLLSSIAGISPTGPDSGLSIMNGAQASIIQTGRSLALELSPRRVNVIAPGVVLTNVWTGDQRANLGQRMERSLPVKRTGEPEHVATAAIGFMVNPYISGAVLTVDGGLHLQ